MRNEHHRGEMVSWHVWAERMLEIASPSGMGETKIPRRARGRLDSNRARTFAEVCVGHTAEATVWRAGARPGAESGKTQPIQVGAGARVGVTARTK